MIDRKAEFGNPEVQKLPPKNGLGIRGRARLLASALLALAMSIPSASAQEGNVFEDDGRFPQCTNVKMADRSILFEDPLTAKPPFTAVHPQLRQATETLYMNGLYDLIARDILPQGAKFRMSGSAHPFIYCLPDEINGVRRAFIQTDERVEAGLPGGGSDGILEFELPEGLNPIIIERFGPTYSGGTPQRRQWLLLMVGLGERITVRNSDGSLTMVGIGPLSIPIYGAEGSRSIQLILPEDGFAQDKPVPQR